MVQKAWNSALTIGNKLKHLFLTSFIITPGSQSKKLY